MALGTEPWQEGNCAKLLIVPSGSVDCTEIVVCALALASAAACAEIVIVAGFGMLAGAMNRPLESIDPAVECQETAWLDAPVTVAAN